MPKKAGSKPNGYWALERSKKMPCDLSTGPTGVAAQIALSGGYRNGWLDECCGHDGKPY